MRRDHYRRAGRLAALGVIMARLFQASESAEARRGRGDRLGRRLATALTRAPPPSPRCRRRAPATQGDDRSGPGCGRRPISESVPHSPPTAITASPRGDHGEVARLADPGRDDVGAVRVGLLDRDRPGRSRSRRRRPAPRPAPPPPSPRPRPPQTTVTPASASSRPTSSASRPSSEPGSPRLEPMTAT